jgi:hypothetical protein
VPIYEACRAEGGLWLAPIPDNAVGGLHPDRDRHRLGVKRLGETYHDHMGYHERSTIESTNGALKRSLNLSSRVRGFGAQGKEISWQLYFYAVDLTKEHRVPLAATG